jgi:hypothetical protein
VKWGRWFAPVHLEAESTIRDSLGYREVEKVLRPYKVIFEHTPELLMKSCQVVLWILALSLVSAFSEAQSQPAVSPASPTTSTADGSKIDPAEAADIRHLLELVGTKDLITQSFGGTMTQIRPLVTNSLPAGAYREKLVDLFFAKFQSKIDLDQFLNMAVPIYHKYFTHDEVKGLIAFYETPLGHKSITVLPKLSEELRDIGQKWGQDLGRQSMAEVLAEHPELEKDMEDARKSSLPK